MNTWDNMKGKPKEIKEFLIVLFIVIDLIIKKYNPVELIHLYELHAIDVSFLSSLI